MTIEFEETLASEIRWMDGKNEMLLLTLLNSKRCGPRLSVCVASQP